MAMSIARTLDDGMSAEFETALSQLHEAGGQSVGAVQTAARDIDRLLARLQGRVTPATLRDRERQLLREILASGAAGNYLDYVSAEQAFMAVQMLVFEIGDARLEENLVALGDALQDDERYRPGRFASLLAAMDGN